MIHEENYDLVEFYIHALLVQKKLHYRNHGRYDF